MAFTPIAPRPLLPGEEGYDATAPGTTVNLSPADWATLNQRSGGDAAGEAGRSTGSGYTYDPTLDGAQSGGSPGTSSGGSPANQSAGTSTPPATQPNESNGGEAPPPPSPDSDGGEAPPASSQFNQPAAPAPYGSSYKRRRIDVTFTLGEGSFGEAGSNTVTVKGLRCSCSIVKAGGASMSEMQLRIFGLSLSTMNKLSTLGMLLTEVRKNSVAVTVGDDQSGMSLIFEGTIYESHADFRGAPSVALSVVAHAGLYNAIKPVPPNSYKGAKDVAAIMSDLAGQMGLIFENSGVSGQYPNVYLCGTARMQAEDMAHMADINWIIDGNKLAIWPKGVGRGQLIPLVSPATGLVGYPTYTSVGVAFATLFNPAIEFGSMIQLQSSNQPACGKWIVQTLVYNLESETPNGAWFTEVTAAKPGYGLVPS